MSFLNIIAGGLVPLSPQSFFGSFNSGGAPGTFFMSTAVDGSGSMYMVGNYSSTALTGGAKILISKVDQHGIVNWSYASSTTANVFADCVVLDNTNSNFYVSGRNSGAYFIQKFSTSDGYSGTLTPIWQRRFGKNASNSTFYGYLTGSYRVPCVIDSTGNYLTVGHTEINSSNGYIIKHYTSNGMIVLQNQITSNYFGTNGITGVGNSFIISDMAMSTNSTILDQMSITGTSYYNTKASGSTSTLYSYGGVNARINNSGSSSFSFVENPLFIYSGTSAVIKMGGVAFDNTNPNGALYLSALYQNSSAFQQVVGFYNFSTGTLSNEGNNIMTEPIYPFSIAVPPSQSLLSTAGIFTSGFDENSNTVTVGNITNWSSGLTVLYGVANFNFSPVYSDFAPVSPNIAQIKTDGVYLYFVGNYESPATGSYPRAFFGRIPVSFAKTGTYTLPDSVSLTYYKKTGYTTTSNPLSSTKNPCSLVASTAVAVQANTSLTYSPVTITDLTI